MTSSSHPSTHISFNQKLFARIRVAIESDAPHIYKLMQHIFAYHNRTHLLKFTENSIASALFNPKFPHLSPVTTLILEVSPYPFPPYSTAKLGSKATNFVESPLSMDFEDRSNILLGIKEIDLDLPLIDEESEKYRVVKDHHEDVFIAGYVNFYPCFSSFSENPVLHMEDFFIRECYRRKGFGKWMFSAMASEATRMGISSINWVASNWNESALDFYTQMGATISDDFRVLSLAGKALEAFGNDSN